MIGTDTKVKIPEPMRSAVSWNITGACNYRCTYCVQKKSSKKHVPSTKEVDRFLAAFGELPGSWEFKISGGEPFVLPGIVRIAAGLREVGHQVSMLTNLSASMERP